MRISVRIVLCFFKGGVHFWLVGSFRASCCFVECLVIFRHSGGPLPSVYHQFADAVFSVCPNMMVRIVVADPDRDLDVELSAISSLMHRSLSASTLRKTDFKWLQQNESRC